MEVGKPITTSTQGGGNLINSLDINRNDILMEDENQQIDTYEETQLNPKGFFAETKVVSNAYTCN